MTLVEIPSTIEGVPGVVRGPADRSPRRSDRPGARPIPDPTSPGIIACRTITKRRAVNFYLGLSLAPEPKRSALLALYAWMREADDLADGALPSEPPSTRMAALESFAGRTMDVLGRRRPLWGGGRPDAPGARSATAAPTTRTPTPQTSSQAAEASPAPARVPREPLATRRDLSRATPSDGSHEAWWDGFEAMLSAYPVPGSVFADALEALRRDAVAEAEAADVGTEEELAWYADHVAGTVAIACLSIWGVRGRDGEVSAAEAARAGRLAVLRGRAVQLTNILRDLREDIGDEARRGQRRSYLPRESYTRHGLTPESLLAWQDAPRCERFLAEWTGEAWRLFDASAALESVVDPPCARVSWALSAMYRALLETMTRHPRRVVQERVRVAPRRKLGIAVRGYLGVGLPG